MRRLLAIVVVACEVSAFAGCRSQRAPSGEGPAKGGAGKAEAPKTEPTTAGPAKKKEAKLPELDAFLGERRESAGLPAISAALVVGGEVVWSGASGFADVAKKTPATPDTVFYSASIGKTVTATALMQHWENGLFALDDDVSSYLPVKVRNPKHPDDKITFRQLLTHTSSLLDTDVVDDLVTPGDGTVSLDAFMRGYLVPGGAYWDDGNFGEQAPGEKFVYSNAGATLLGWLAERIGKKPFDAQCDERIFRPLGMKHTSWRLDGLPTGSVIALGYRKNKPLPRYGQDPAYPSGALQTTAIDMGRFLAAFSHRGKLGEAGGARILSDSTVAEMQKPEPGPGGDEGYGLVWYRQKLGEVTLTGHSGSYDGFNSEMWFRPDTGAGFVFFVNADEIADDDDDELSARLLREADTLAKP